MNVAALSLCRDRLDYTRFCFGTLRENAGIDYDHFVLDNGSTDGTREWLLADEWYDVTCLDENIGICRGLNLLLDEACDAEQYDLIVRVDNDAEVLQPDTLRVVCEVALEHTAIVAPRVLGLLNPPPTIRETLLGSYTLAETAILGGVFHAIPAVLFTEHGFRYDERSPLYTGDEAIVPWWRAHGGRAGYLDGFSVNHYLGTAGQIADDPAYHDRKLAEMAA